MNTLCIIPARSGSKGVKNKNIKKIKGKTLIEHAYNVANKSKIFDKIILSTDSKKYLNLLKKKIDTPFLRPKKISEDNTTDIEVLFYELKIYEKYYRKKFDYVCLLQPTSPLRTIEYLKKSLRKIKNFKADALWTVSRVDTKYHPIKQVFSKNFFLKYYDKKGKFYKSRNDLNQTFIRNGVAYFFSRKAIIQYKTIMPKKTCFFEITKKIANIDNLNDLNFAIKNFK